MSDKSTEEALRKSLGFFESALDKDPRFARAWTGIAKSWLWLADGYVEPLEAYSKVREAARGLGIPIWDAPAAPCLSSRIRYGLAVTPARLEQVERAEAVLRAVGVSGDLRVRHGGDEARSEVAPAMLSRVRGRRDTVARHLLALGFARVTLDLDGYGRGKLLGDRPPRVELLGERP